MFDDSLIFYDEFTNRDTSLEIRPREFDIDDPSMYQFISACEFLRREFSLAYSTGDNDVLTHEFILTAFEILQNAPAIVDDFTDGIEVIEKYLCRVRNQVLSIRWEEKFIPLDNAYFFNSVVRNTFEKALLNWLAVAYVPNYERVLQGIFAAAQNKGGHLNLYGNHEIYMIGEEIQFDYTEIQNTDTVFLNGETIPQMLFVIQALSNKPCAVRQKASGDRHSISQGDFAHLLKWYGGKRHGTRRTKECILNWEREPEKAKSAGGIKYTASLRDDPIAARRWAEVFNQENQCAYLAKKANI